MCILYMKGTVFSTTLSGYGRGGEKFYYIENKWGKEVRIVTINGGIYASEVAHDSRECLCSVGIKLQKAECHTLSKVWVY